MIKNHKHWTFNLKFLKYINVAEQLVKERNKTPENKEKNTNQRFCFRITVTYFVSRRSRVSDFLVLLTLTISDTTHVQQRATKKKTVKCFYPFEGGYTLNINIILSQDDPQRGNIPFYKLRGGNQVPGIQDLIHSVIFFSFREMQAR